ncbi:MAG: ATP-dependent Clp protease adaptor ClpS [Kiritimatiellae bacterium]|nr:ATP-dependent Clp protease adaptor ClpS [Kiritimatiellia bacterium]
MPTIAPPRKRKAPSPKTEEPVVVPDDGLGDGLGWDSQVVLFNDDVNWFSDVIRLLCAVFGHSEQLAEKIAVEAHVRGRAIAEVEERAKAEIHAAALRAGGLRATVESVG